MAQFKSAFFLFIDFPLGNASCWFDVYLSVGDGGGRAILDGSG